MKGFRYEKSFWNGYRKGVGELESLCLTLPFSRNMASVKWGVRAVHDLRALDQTTRERVVHKVSWLAKNFKNIVPEKLHYQLNDLYKLRVGDYRVVYSLDVAIVIEAVGHRRDIYH